MFLRIRQEIPRSLLEQGILIAMGVSRFGQAGSGHRLLVLGLGFVSLNPDYSGKEVAQNKP
jgi:hypothetical protein